MKTNIKAWNDIDVRIFTKANETFWERYNAIPNVAKLEQEFKYETGSFLQTNVTRRGIRNQVIPLLRGTALKCFKKELKNYVSWKSRDFKIN